MLVALLLLTLVAVAAPVSRGVGVAAVAIFVVGGTRSAGKALRLAHVCEACASCL